MAKRFKFAIRPAVGNAKAPVYKPKAGERTRAISRKANKSLIKAMVKGNTKAFSSVRRLADFKRRLATGKAKKAAAKAAREAARRNAIARSKAPKLKTSTVRRLRLAAARANAMAKAVAAQKAAKAAQQAAAATARNQRFAARLAKARRGVALKTKARTNAGSSDHK